MVRILFLKKNGQRKFLESVRDNLSVSSIRGILQFGFDVPYSTLKNYYSESRLMSKELFLDMCGLAGLKVEDYLFEEVDDAWGQKLGGSLSKRRRKTNV